MIDRLPSWATGGTARFVLATAVVAALFIAFTGAGDPVGVPPDVGVERVPVAHFETGERMGTIPVEAIDEVAAGGDPVPVIDDDGVQTGWWTTDGFVDLEDHDPQE